MTELIFILLFAFLISFFSGKASIGLQNWGGIVIFSLLIISSSNYYSFFSVLLIGLFKLIGIKNKKSADFLFFAFSLIFIIYHLIAYNPEIATLYFHSNSIENLPKAPFISFFLLHYLVVNKEDSSYSYTNNFSHFISLNLLKTENKSEQISLKLIDKLKLMLPYVLIFFISRYLFTDSFMYWKNQVSLTNANSYNTMQAIFVFINNSFLGISYFVQGVAFLSVIQILFNKRGINREIVVAYFKRIHQLPFLSKFFISLIFGICFFNPFLIIIILLLLFTPFQYKWVRYFQQALILSVSFLLISPDYYFSKAIFIGIINLKTLFIYYNEYFILSPFNMCYLTFIVFILFALFIYYLLLEKRKWSVTSFSYIGLIASITVFAFKPEVIEVYENTLMNARKTKPLENKLARFVSPIIENKGFHQSFTQLEEVKRELITSNFNKNKRLKSDELIVFHTDLQAKYSKFNLDLPTIPSKKSYTIYQNKWTTVQSLFVPTNDQIKILSIEVKSPATFLTKEIYRGEYVYCKASSYHSKPAGWIIDPLIPIIQKQHQFNTKLTIPYLENRCFFLNLFCSSKSKTGVYPVNYIVTYLNSEGIKKTIKNYFTLKVRKSIKSQKPKIQQAFSFDPWWVNWYYNDSTMADRNSKVYCAFLHKFNITPTFLYGKPQIWPSINELKQMKTEKFCVGYLNVSGNKNSIHENSIQEIKERITILKKHKLHQNAYLFVCDEVTPDHWKNIDYIRKSLKKEGLDFIPIITTSYGYHFKNKKDYECPVLENFMKTKNNLSDSTWTYICNTTTHPYPNFFLEYPLSDITDLFKTLKSNKINGFLYWSLNCWNNNLPKKNAPKQFNPQTWNTYSYKQFNGDGMFIYPGPNGQLYPSIRLMKLRDELVGN